METDASKICKEAYTDGHSGDILPWYSGDLRARMALALRFAERILNPQYGNQPYFFYAREAETGEAFGWGDKGSGMTHCIGRGMDLIFNAEKYTGLSVLPEVEETYTRQFFDYLDSEFAMCAEYQSDELPRQIELHNIRETVEAVALLLERRKDSRAGACVDKIFRGLELLLDKETGKFSVPLRENNRLVNRVNGSIGALQPQNAGRLTGPLMWLWRVTGDERCKEYAGICARGTLDCFTDEGEMKWEAGTHIHSITSSLFGAADYALTTRNYTMMDKLERLYLHPKGLPLVTSSWGWVKEQINVPGEVQGEVNQIGDMIQFQMLMGDADIADAAEWYARAETFMRGGLLPAQVLNPNVANPNAPSPEDRRFDCRHRIPGGFGFPMPASRLQTPGSAIATLDVTQGACQAVFRMIDRIAVRKNGSTFINFYFDNENDVAMLKSELPRRGCVLMLPKIGGNLYFRIPENCKKDSLHFTVDGESCDYTIVHGYAKLCDRKRGDVIRMLFEPDVTKYEEIHNGISYTVKKYGEQVVSVTPSDGIFPLYDDFTK